MKKNFDLIVVGGGSAGWVAALAAARHQLKTLLIERYGFLGGSATVSLVGPFMRYWSSSEQLIKGIFEEFSKRMTALGGMHHNTFDFETYKYVAQEMCLEAGVNLLFHTYMTGCQTKDNTIKSLELVNKGGKQKLAAKLFIDASGDADLAAAAGVPFQLGREQDSLGQALTLMFLVGGVDFERVEKYFQEHPEEFLPWKESYFETGVLSRAGFFSLIKKAQQQGKLSPLIKHLFFISIPKDQLVVFNTTHVVDIHPLDPEQLTRAEIEGRRQLWQIVELLHQLPGFEDSYLVQSGLHIGVRESRHILGEYVFTADDVRHGAKFPDAIARGNYGIDIHSPCEDEAVIDQEILPEEIEYEIPYRCLVPQKIDNLLVAGRSVSATHEGASAIRIQPLCMAMGEAAGVAVALSLSHQTTPRQLDVALLQRTLLAQGVNLPKRLTS